MVSAFEPIALPSLMHSRLCSIACRRTAGSVWREAAELVGERLAGRILKGVGVHRVEAEAARLGVVDQLGRIVVAVPGDVQRDARRRAGQLMDDGAIVELVEDVARLADAGEAGEARAAGADAPGRHGDREGGGLGLDLVDVDVAAAENVARAPRIRSSAPRTRTRSGGPISVLSIPAPRHSIPPDTSLSHAGANL